MPGRTQWAGAWADSRDGQALFFAVGRSSAPYTSSFWGGASRAWRAATRIRPNASGGDRALPVLVIGFRKRLPKSSVPLIRAMDIA
jgi:hypothetical protein